MDALHHGGREKHVGSKLLNLHLAVHLPVHLLSLHLLNLHLLNLHLLNLHLLRLHLLHLHLLRLHLLRLHLLRLHLLHLHLPVHLALKLALLCESRHNEESNKESK